MIGLLLIYWIGKAFYDLADTHEKSKWGFAVIGVISYYGGTLLGGAVIGVFMALVLEYDIESIPELGLSLLSIPFGLLICWGLFKLLQRNWEKTSAAAMINDDTLDGGMMGNN